MSISQNKSNHKNSGTDISDQATPDNSTGKPSDLIKQDKINKLKAKLEAEQLAQEKEEELKRK